MVGLMTKPKSKRKVFEIVCKKAGFLYHIEKKIEVGICLYGAEVKAIRNYKVSLTSSYAHFSKNECWLYKMPINTTYAQMPSQKDIDMDRPKKLLMHKKEIRKLIGFISQKGYTLVPLRLYEVRGFIKMELGLCKGKKEYDRRADIKKRDQDREFNRDMKSEFME